MQTISVSSLLFTDLTKSVPSTIDEYNALAPKRTNPILEDAVDNIMKHKVLSQFRNKFLDFVEEKFKDIEGSARQNFGTEDRPRWEADMPYINRLQALVLKSRGEDPTNAAAQATFVTELRADAQRILDEVPFNVAEREPSSVSPSVSKTHTTWAKEAVESGKAEALLGLLNQKLGTAYVLVGDSEKDVETVAKAIAANEKAKRLAAEQAAKAEYGLAVE